jgi:hypothetical protein
MEVAERSFMHSNASKLSSGPDQHPNGNQSYRFPAPSLLYSQPVCCSVSLARDKRHGGA